MFILKYYQCIILGEHLEVWFSVLTTQYILILVRAINVFLLKTILVLYMCNVRTRFPLQNFLRIQAVQHVEKAFFSLKSKKNPKTFMA